MMGINKERSIHTAICLQGSTARIDMIDRQMLSAVLFMQNGLVFLIQLPQIMQKRTRADNRQKRFPRLFEVASRLRGIPLCFLQDAYNVIPIGLRGTAVPRCEPNKSSRIDQIDTALHKPAHAIGQAVLSS